VDEFGLGTKKDTPMSRPFAARVGKRLWSWCMLPLWEGEATVIEKSSTYEIRRPLSIDMCGGARYRRNRRGEMCYGDSNVLRTSECTRPDRSSFRKYV